MMNQKTRWNGDTRLTADEVKSRINGMQEEDQILSKMYFPGCFMTFVSNDDGTYSPSEYLSLPFLKPSDDLEEISLWIDWAFEQFRFDVRMLSVDEDSRTFTHYVDCEMRNIHEGDYLFISEGTTGCEYTGIVKMMNGQWSVAPATLEDYLEWDTPCVPIGSIKRMKRKIL